MSIKMLKAFAVLLMLLALGCVGGAILAAAQRDEIQGPSALAVLPDKSVWVSVEDSLWHLDTNGKRLMIVDGATLGVGGRIGNLMAHPNGQLVAQVRNDPTLYFLDPKTAVIKLRLLPQWQSDLSQHGSNAINYAFHDDGRVAIATGGGHAVAVFDAEGRFLGRTKPGTYEFTNGLWWSADSLWTTDTNKQALVELDGSTLDEKSRIQLSKNRGGFQFLGMAVPSGGKASEESRTSPLVTLVRFANGMTRGRASDIFSDGIQLDYPAPVTAEPRDLKWHGNELLMVDGGTFSIKRYSTDRITMDDFGDAQTQSDLAATFDQRNNFEKQYSGYLGGAILLFIIGFIFAIRAQSLEKAQALAVSNVDLSQLGTPILTARTRFVASIKIFWPLILAMSALATAPFLIGRLSGFVQLSPAISLLIYFMLQLFFIYALILLRRSLQRHVSDSATEAIFNHRATQFLQTDTSFWKKRQPDELPQETLMLAGAKGGLKWVVLTNQRLLVFVANLRDRTLAHAYQSSDIQGIRILVPDELTWKQKLQRFLNPIGAVIRIEFSDGNSLVGFTTSAQTARRMSSLLQYITLDTLPVNAEIQAQIAQTSPRAIAMQNKKAIRQSVASFLVPGLGQWMQRRSGTALICFVFWLFVLMLVLVMAWTLWNSLAAVSLRSIIAVTSYYIALCTLAAWDTWRMRERQ